MATITELAPRTGVEHQNAAKEPLERRPLILVAESSFNVRRNLVVGLSRQDFNVLYSTNAQDTQALITDSHPDLIVVNPISLEWLTSDDLRPPYIVITPASSANIDRLGINALNDGADFFLPEPVSPDFLAVHIRASLRSRQPYLDSKTHKIGDLTVTPGFLQKDGKRIALTRTESALLTALIERRRGIVLTNRDALVSISDHMQIRNSMHLTERISRLRKKIREIETRDLIKTVKGVGYILESPEDSLRHQAEQEENTALAPEPTDEIKEAQTTGRQGTEVFVRFVEGKNGVKVDLEEDAVTKNGKKISLPLTQRRLLLFLAKNHGRIMFGSEILSDVWGPQYIGYPDLVRIEIHRLRVNIEDDTKKPEVIKTVRDMGYIFTDPDQEFLGDSGSATE
ncbi:MAG: winged helix-turn-helix domain-containing protein [Patescibacteria group bacterium]|nr:winged helix-turn-helix domain-containing protein [Patescibacteria group bacterium]